MRLQTLVSEHHWSQDTRLRTFIVLRHSVSLDPLSKTCQIWAQWVTGPPAQQKTGHHCIWWFFLEPAGTSLNGAAHDQSSTRNSAAARGIRKRAVPLPFSSMAYYSYAIIDTSSYTSKRQVPDPKCLLSHHHHPDSHRPLRPYRSPSGTFSPYGISYLRILLTVGPCLSYDFAEPQGLASLTV